MPDSASYFFSKTVDEIIECLEHNHAVAAANVFKGACSRHHFSQQALTAAVRTQLAAVYSLKADRFMAALNAGISMQKGA